MDIEEITAKVKLLDDYKAALEENADLRVVPGLPFADRTNLRKT